MTITNVIGSSLRIASHSLQFGINVVGSTFVQLITAVREISEELHDVGDKLCKEACMIASEPTGAAPSAPTGRPVEPEWTTPPAGGKRVAAEETMMTLCSVDMEPGQVFRGKFRSPVAARLVNFSSPNPDGFLIESLKIADKELIVSPIQARTLVESEVINKIINWPTVAVGDKIEITVHNESPEKRDFNAILHGREGTFVPPVMYANAVKAVFDKLTEMADRMKAPTPEASPPAAPPAEPEAASATGA